MIDPSTTAIESDIAALLARGAGAGVACVYLFGSVAEGRSHRESDVDLAVLFFHGHVPTSRERFEESLRLRALLGPATGRVDVDLVVLNDAPPGLAARIVTTGKRLFCRDDETDHAFRRDAQLRAADVEPFIRRTAAIKLESLGR